MGRARREPPRRWSARSVRSAAARARLTLAYNASGDARIEVEARAGDADPRPLVDGWGDMQHWFAVAGLEATARGTCTSAGSIRTLTIKDFDGATYKLYGTCVQYSTAEGSLVERFRFADIPDAPMTVVVERARMPGATHRVRVDVPLAAAPADARGRLAPRVVRLHQVLEILMRYLSSTSRAD